jgi:plasmid stability protein
MTAMIQIRNVPDALHPRLKSRAVLAGMSLSDYLLAEIRRVAERPTLDELRARLERRSGITPAIAPAEAVRAERGRKRSSSMPLRCSKRFCARQRQRRWKGGYSPLMRRCTHLICSTLKSRKSSGAMWRMGD